MISSCVLTQKPHNEREKGKLIILSIATLCVQDSVTGDQNAQYKEPDMFQSYTV